MTVALHVRLPVGLDDRVGGLASAVLEPVAVTVARRALRTERGRLRPHSDSTGYMSTIKDIIEFRSRKFSPGLPEGSQVNPEVYGAELAFWLCQELAARGVVTSYPEYEDWGWYIEFLPESGAEFAVHCSNVDGSKDHWLLSLRRRPRKLFGRDKPPYSEASSLIRAIRGAVEEAAEASELEWLYEELDST